MSTVTNSSLAARDLQHVWHPCTQMKDHEQHPPIPVRRAQGVWLEDFDGRRYLDAISSWWGHLCGDARRREGEEQEVRGGAPRGRGIALTEELVRITPPGLTRCFYADSGSAAIE